MTSSSTSSRWVTVAARLIGGGVPATLGLPTRRLRAPGRAPHPSTLFRPSAVQGLNARLGKELATIAEQYPFKPLRYLRKAPRLTFAEGMEMLQGAGYEARQGCL